MTDKGYYTLREIADMSINPKTGKALTYCRVWQIMKEKEVPHERHGATYLVTAENYEKYFGEKK